MNIILYPLLKALLFILSGYKILLLAYALFSWLYLFGIIKPDSNFFTTIYQLLTSIIEPLLTPLRKFIPSPGGIDLSFIVLFIITQMASEIVQRFLISISHHSDFII
ncbi:MAG: hypothetical protein CMM87_02845 [Rickettsiales bacterium]|nr:hypothetical protein [Rickettsiales bacterium]|tara:strand:- start:13480 stop:13800 length:321 start_codon:yes stop_codon:yes gene_type:complete